MSPRIVNPIFFFRGYEPRQAVDLIGTATKCVALMRAHGLPATYLLQYDAMRQSQYVTLLKGLPPGNEIGCWLEMVEELVEKAGAKWQGRWAWDWESHTGGIIGYTPDERRRIIDVYMDEFFSHFGRHPSSVGSWILDTVSLNYLSDKYHIVAACNCKDQTGTDGYTLWGGYWNQAYYPTRVNAFLPAQDQDKQVPVPVFRMLGSDPITQYDSDLGEARQKVQSVEPVYKDGGGLPSWIDWYFDIKFNTPCLAFSHTQVGQENPFGWPAMQKGLEYQMASLEKLRDQDLIRVETLEESGKWFRSQFETTPATATVALSDSKGANIKTVWYNSRFYRTNLYWENDEFRIRDIQLFDQSYPERYLERRCESADSVFDAWPIVDGFCWSDRDYRAGLRILTKSGDSEWMPGAGSDLTTTEVGDSELQVSWPLKGGGTVIFDCQERQIRVRLADSDPSVSWILEMSWSAKKQPGIVDVRDSGVVYEHEGYRYELHLAQGTVKRSDHGSIVCTPRDGALVFDFNRL